MKAKKIIPISVVSLLLCGCILYFSINPSFNQNKIAYAEEVQNILQNMEAELQQLMDNNPELSFSSNPYDYIENNEYYQSLIAMGVNALPSLEQALVLASQEERFGLTEYLAALAMEEISQLQVNQVLYNSHQKSWGDSGEFLEQWLAAKNKTPELVNEILASSNSNEVKINEIKKFGVLAVPEVAKYLADTNEGLSTNANQSLQEFVNNFTLEDTQKETLQQYVTN